MTKKRHLFNIILVLAVVCHIFLLLQLIFFPYPELFIYSYLTDKGLLPYKEIFDQHFPGLMFLPVNLHSLGIDNLLKMRILHLGLILVSDILFIKISKRIFKSKVFVALSLLLYIFWQIYFEGHVMWIESFVTPIILLAFLFFLDYMEKKNTTELYISAFILGISLVFKQTIAPLIFIVFLFLIIKKTNIKKVLISLIMVTLPMILIFIHFYRMGVLNDFIYWTINFNLTTFSQMGKTYPTAVNILKLIPTFGFSVISLIILLKKQKTGPHIILSIFLLGTLFFAYARFDYIHLQPALPFSVLLFLQSFKYIGKKLLISFLLLYSVISLYLFIPNFRFYNDPGRSPMFNDYETVLLVNSVNKYLKYDKKVFAMGTYPHIYYLTDTLPPGNIFSFQFPWFMKIVENRILEGIIADSPDIIIRDSASRVNGYRLIEYMQNIEKYLEAHYKTDESVNNIEILVKI